MVNLNGAEEQLWNLVNVSEIHVSSTSRKPLSFWESIDSLEEKKLITVEVNFRDTENEYWVLRKIELESVMVPTALILWMRN